MPAEPLRPKPSFLESWGMRRLRTESKSDDTSIEVLTPQEQHALRRIQRDAVLRAAGAGALSALVSASAAIAAGDPDQDPVRYWSLVGGATLVASIFEIGFLYFDALRAVREMAAAAGLTLDPETDHAELATVLARAALELPSPPHNALLVDPHREASRLTLLVSGLLYKAKIALTSFLLKALLRRALGRAVARSALELIAIPVTALWNAVVTQWVLGEARLCIIGPSAARELAAWTARSPECGDLPLEAIACVIVKARGVHPNTEYLGRLFLGEGAVPPGLGDESVFLRDLAAATPETALCTLRTLAAAAIIDGRLTRRERKLVAHAFGARGATVPWTELEELRRHMVAGDGLRRDLLQGLDQRLAEKTQI
jgi:hypothetical protein